VPAIDIKGSTTVSDWAINLDNASGSGNILIQSTAATGGGLAIEGTSNGNVGLHNRINNGRTQILSNAGNINITTNSSNGTNGDFAVRSQNGFYIGERFDATAVNGITPVTGFSGNVTITARGSIDSEDALIIRSAGANANITLTANNISALGAGSTVTAGGALVYEPYSTSFSTAQSWPSNNLTVSSGFSGLRLGKEGNTANITTTTAQTIAGPISVYGGNIAVNENLNTSAGSAAGDVLLKASGNVNLANSKSITTDGGDVTYWADSDANDNGYVQLGSSSSVSTSGGNITLGGGSDINTGYARGNATLDKETEPTFDLAISGVHLKNGTSLASDGGNITLRGKNLGSSVNNLEFGILGHNTTVNSGSGKISMEGIALGSGNANAQGISFFGDGWIIRSSNPNSDAIQIIGDASGTANSITSLGINFTGTIESTGGGGVYMLGKAGTASSYDHPFDVRGDILANAGDILLVAENDVDTQTGLYFDTGTNLGFKSATNITASSSAIILKSDNTEFNVAVPINTSGAVSIVPLDASTSFGVAQTIGSNMVLDAGVTGLTVGKAGNTANVTIGAAQTIAGPISVYGGNLALNAATTATGSDINLYASGAVTQTAALTANRLALNGTGSFTLQNSANNVGIIAGGDGTTRLGNLAYRDADALEIGSVNPDGIFSSGTVLIETENGDITLSQNINTTSTSSDAIIVNAGKACQHRHSYRRGY
jgi:hypothetical protein